VLLVDPYPHIKALAGAAVLDPERRLRHGGERVGVLLSPGVEPNGSAGGLEGGDQKWPLPDIDKLSGHGGSLDGWSVIAVPAGTGQTKPGCAIVRRRG
jgi:hypothetical protein